MENQSPETKNLKTGIIVLIILFVGSLGMNLFFWNKNAQLQTMYQSRVDTLTISNTALEGTVKSRVAELQIFKGKNDSLDKVIQEGTEKITAMETEVETLKKEVKHDASKRKQLEKKIADLTKLTDEYLERIDQLVTQNDLLQKQNDTLNSNLTKANSDRTMLQGKVNTASTLRTEFIKVTPLKKKMIGDKLDQTSMAKKVVSFKTCFTIMENRIANPGKRSIYLRIVAPDGKVVGNTASNSGKFRKSNGDELQYTANHEVNYTGAKIEECINYDESEKGVFTPGNYVVEVYIDGTLTATVGVPLK